MKCKIMRWDEFRELCRNDAELWRLNGYTVDTVAAEDILEEYPKDYWEEYDEEPDVNEDSWCFVPEDFVEKTLEYLETICEGE